jgi:predicted amidohydrolase
MAKKTVSVIQHPSVLLDSHESLGRASDLIADAAKQGADLVVFPETWLSCYPAWVFGLAGWNDEIARSWYQKLLDDSLVIGDAADLQDDLKLLREAAITNDVTIVMGMNERARSHSGSLFNTLVTISPQGHLLNVHRKLTPTHAERIVWAPGDASGLRVVDTPVGKVGGLVCWEHWHPLARQALHLQDEQIHIAVWPDMPEMHHVASRSYAFEGRCFVACAGQFLTVDDVPEELMEAFLKGAGAKRGQDRIIFSGGSGIIGPDGGWLAGPIYGQAEIITATIDLTQAAAFHHDLDVAGHYQRPDVFELHIDRNRYSGFKFITN